MKQNCSCGCCIIIYYVRGPLFLMHDHLQEENIISLLNELEYKYKVVLNINSCTFLYANQLQYALRCLHLKKSSTANKQDKSTDHPCFIFVGS